MQKVTRTATRTRIPLEEALSTCDDDEREELQSRLTAVREKFDEKIARAKNVDASLLAAFVAQTLDFTLPEMAPEISEDAATLEVAHHLYDGLCVTFCQ